MFKNLLSCVLLCIVSTHCFGEEISNSKAWLNLGHYKRCGQNCFESQVDGPNFFLSSEGKTSPEKELNATIQAMREPLVVGIEHAQCRFPARYLWLTTIVKHSFNKIECSRYQRFKENIAAKSVTLVFSSYYLNNPSSAFGHTLIRFNKTGFDQENSHYQLFDYGINFSAQVTTKNPILYALNGLTGKFRGTFASIPYYYKVREYNDYESRDLWEYDLNLTSLQIELLVAHFWELGLTYFDYFYLSENCSYHMITALAAAVPELNLVEHLGYVVLPTDTLKVISEAPGFVKNIHFRPSIRRTARSRINLLSSDEKNALKKIIHSKSLSSLDNYLSSQKTKILDALIDLIDADYPAEILNSASDISKWKKNLLLARSKLLEKAETIIIPPPQNEFPHLGHHSRRTGASYFYQKDGAHGIQLNFRYALHDFLDRSIGYPELSQIEFFNTKVNFYFDNFKFEFEKSKIIGISSLNPYTEFEQSLSWSSALLVKRFYLKDCNQCIGAALENGLGYTFNLYSKENSYPRIYLYSLLQVNFAGSPGFTRLPIQLQTGPKIGILKNFRANFKSKLEASYLFLFPTANQGYFQIEASTRYGIFSNFAIGLVYDQTYQNWKVGTEAYVYF